MLDSLSVIEEGASVSEITGVARRIRHLPSVNHVAIDIDQINLATTALRREQGKAGKRTIVIAGAQTDAGALCLDLFNWWHKVPLIRF